MKVEVEITRGGHIIYKDEIIGVLGQWNRYEDLDEDTLYNQIKNSTKNNNISSFK